MGRGSQWKLGWLVATVAALVALARADAATVNKKARLRVGPSKDTTLLGWIEEGTVVTTDGERAGWYLVHTPDGQTGYIWQDHLNLDPSERVVSGPTTVTTAAPASSSTTVPVAPPTTIATEARTPTPPPPVPPPAPAAEPEPAVGAELERLRTEVARLATNQQELVQRLERDGTGPIDSGPEPSAGPAVIFLAIGAMIGWIVHWALQVRRDRRPRIRL
ncbi:MAG TPA: SH3 domain-containing protein [Candidatus Eisenbacteria bacterium]|nr:SH3 domain-containing protein [Candidatus Eisenbacteria bacterium]